MDYNFDTWKKLLTDFQRGVTKDLEEIRKYKEEIRSIKAEIECAVDRSYFLRDDRRIIISAPEVIIGDVDRDGILKAKGSSRVILRAHGVNLDGVGETGQVVTRAASIRQTAVNPGVDGEEAVVGSLSEVVSQAGQISLEANDADGVFSQIPGSAGRGSVNIHADGKLDLEASRSAEIRAKSLEKQISDLEKEKSVASGQVSAGINSYESIAKDIKSMCDANALILADDMLVRAEAASLYQSEEQFKQLSRALYQSFDNCAKWLSRLAEINRKIDCLKKEKDGIKKGDDYKKKPTGASVSLSGELIEVVSRDGDGNLRTNEGAGVNILANDVQVHAIDGKGALQEKGKVTLHAMSLELSTADAKDVKYDDKGKLSGGEFPAAGDVKILSKTVAIESVDQEVKDNELKEKALTKESALNIRVEKMDVSATDTEGKATGSVAVNAKEVSVRSMNVDKEKRTDDKLSEGSTMLLLSEKMFVGAKKKDIKSKKVQVVTEEAGIFADKTLELQQDEAKAALQLSGGNAAVGGSKVEVFGATTITGKTEVKDELKAPKATIDNLEAKTSFKSSNISDGIAIPGAPANGSLSAKLKAEDAPEKK